MLSAVVRAAPDQPGAGSPNSVPAARFAKNVVVITIDREIDATMERSVERRLKAAADNGADAVVLELDTPGGVVGPVLDICKMIKKSPIPNTVAWVHDKAYSGGAFVALSCREIVVSDVARLGDAAPILPTPTILDRRGRAVMTDTERQKILAPLLTEIVDSARKHGYDEKLVQGMVTLGVELWLIENPQTGERLFIDRNEHRMLFGEPPESEPLALASSAPQPAPGSLALSGPPTAPPASAPAPSPGAAPRPGPTDFIPATSKIHDETSRAVSLELTEASKRPPLTAADAPKWRKVEKVSDGHTIFTFTESQILRYGLAAGTVKNDEQLKTFFGATNLRRLDQSWSETLVVFLTQLVVRGVLLVIFLVSLFIEMTHPGVVLPGVVAALAFILLVAPPLLNDMASWWEIAAMLVGIVLLILEIFVIPGFGVCGVLGIILFLVGLVGTFVGTGSAGLFPDSAQPRNELLSGVTTIVLSAATAFGIMWFLAKHVGSIPLLNKLVLKDEVVTDTPAGGLLAAMGPVAGTIARGDLGMALTPLRPAGRVQIRDEIVDVVSDFGFIPAGAQVRVVSVDQFRVTVEPASGTGGTTGERAPPGDRSA